MAQVAGNSAMTISQYMHLFWKSLTQGGLGASIAAGVASANVAIPGIPAAAGVAPPDMAMLTNLGQVTVFVCLGNSTVVATLDCLPVLPGTQVYVPIANYGNSAQFTNIAAITASDTAKIVVTPGFANRS